MARPGKREEIVEAALDRFHAHGFHATGVKDITDAAGVPKGSFYNHFDSKEALAVVALERYGAGRRLEDLADPATPPLARLRAHFEFLQSEFEAYELTRGCMLANFGAEAADHSPEIRTGVDVGFRAWAAAIAGTLSEAREAGSVRTDLDPERTAIFLLSAWEGTLIVARVQQSTEAFAAFFDTTFDTLLGP
jgi:TetR/AcrR family transcriptional regulator, transcriptional repressor for nem operon